MDVTDVSERTNAPIGTVPTDRAERAGVTALRALLENADGLVVGLDFDGTLAPIEEDPDVVQITPANRRAVASLASRSDAIVTVISGRALDDLVPRVGVDDVIYAGNHGFEMTREGVRTVHPDAEAARPLVADACSAIEDRVGDVEGCFVERKGLTATVHYRETPPDQEPAIRAATEAVVDGVDGLRLVPGKQSVEIRPTVDWDKGSAMRRIVEDAPDGFRAVYLGDDTTDEDVFRELDEEGVGVHVGDNADTGAEFTLPSREGVAPFLEWLDGTILGRRR